MGFWCDLPLLKCKIKFIENTLKKIKVAKCILIFKRSWDASISFVPNLQTPGFEGNRPVLVKEARTTIAIKAFMELIQTTVK